MTTPANPPAVLDMIDHAIDDWETSPDAMRWTPEQPAVGVPVVPGHTYAMSAVVDLAESLGMALESWQIAVLHAPPERLTPRFQLEPWEAAALHRIGDHISAAAQRIGEHIGQALKGARLTHGWLDEVYWREARRPQRVTELRRAYRAKKGRKW